ncbi:hypothetical protein [Amycolatopsis kentuckyensis]|uniref:hypothetical protein n=1 Tax=Amycolatopsis kentuckyensis TaxID=218823 RepID=UPI003562F826
MDGKQIYDNFKQGDTDGLRRTSESVNKLSEAYQARAEGIKALQNRMLNAWTGDAADAANAGAGPLELAFAETALPLDETKFSVDTQAAVFDQSGNTVVEVPPKPDKPSPWSVGLKAAIPIAGPFMAKDDIDSYQEGMARYNAANETNVRVMDQYSRATDGTTATMPTNYGVLEEDGASIAVNTPPPPPPIRPLIIDEHELKPNPPGGDDDHTSTTSVDTTHTGGTDRPGGTDKPVGTDRPVGTGRPVGTDKPIGIVEPPWFRPQLPGDETHTTGTGRPVPTRPVLDRPGDTTPNVDGVNYYPTNTGGGGGQNYSNTFGNDPNAPGRGPTSGNAGSRLLDSNGRPISGGGSGAGGSGSGAAGERGLGSGRGSGMGNLGNAAAAEAAAARSAAGRSGQMGPMGPGGRRGEGEEDDEHQRPDFLIEADPDAIFGTDQRTSPPVIGE